MSHQKQDWDDWIDGDAPGNEPLRLRKDAPDEIKKKFEEWEKKMRKTRPKASGGNS